MSADQEPEILYFIGVTTKGSTIQRIFPGWMSVLGRPAALRSIDLPLGTEPRKFRDVLNAISNDPHAVGALVTTHKIDFYRACADMFDELDPLSVNLGEISCIVKRNGKLIGSAKDPVAAAMSMSNFIKPGHWKRHRADLLCLGAGGAGLAISYVAMTNLPEDDRPARVLMADIDSGRLEILGHLHDRINPDMPVHYHRVMKPADNDALIASLRPCSLIVNATGLGKDREGSPVTNKALFPERSLIWELNYRGERGFLQHARQQEEERSLTIVDGWDYFIHGWSQVIAEVFATDLGDDRMAKLTEIANEAA